ncbi:MAG: hypothetical protein ACRDQF_11125, partial [Thermocrispum sp.]
VSATDRGSPEFGAQGQVDGSSLQLEPVADDSGSRLDVAVDTPVEVKGSPPVEPEVDITPGTAPGTAPEQDSQREATQVMSSPPPASAGSSPSSPSSPAASTPSPSPPSPSPPSPTTPVGVSATDRGSPEFGAQGQVDGSSLQLEPVADDSGSRLDVAVGTPVEVEGSPPVEPEVDIAAAEQDSAPAPETAVAATESAPDTTAEPVAEPPDTTAEPVAEPPDAATAAPATLPVASAPAPAASSLLAELRDSRAKVETPPDGTAIRAEIIRLTGATGDLRARIETEFSDQNLADRFTRALDGGHMADLGAGPTAPEVTVTVVAIGPDRTGADTEMTRAETTASTTERHESTETSEPVRSVTGPSEFRLPTPIGTVALKLAGVVNSRTDTGSASGSSTRSTTVRMPDTLLSTGEHDVAYRVDVRRRGRATRSGEAAAPVRLQFERQAPVTATDANGSQELRHAEFTGVGQIYASIRESMGSSFRVNDPGVRQLREWLATLSDDAKGLLEGKVARRTFTFGWRKRPTEVVIGLAERGHSRMVSIADGVIEHEQHRDGEYRSGRSVTRSAGGVLKVMPGVPLFGAGPAGGYLQSSTSSTEAAGDFGREDRETYHGPIEQHVSPVTFAVRVGPDGGSRARNHTVDGSATFWLGSADEAVLRDDDAGAEIAPAVPDRVDARYRLPDAVVDAITGPIALALRNESTVAPKDLVEVAERLREFVRDNAREIARGGDRVRFPLSEIRSGYPELYLDGAIDVAAASYRGVLPGRSAQTTTSAGTGQKSAAAGRTEIAGGASGYVIAMPMAWPDLHVVADRTDSGDDPLHISAHTLPSADGPLGRWEFPLRVTASVQPDDGARRAVAVVDASVQVDSGRPESDAPTQVTAGQQADWTERAAPLERDGFLPAIYQLESAKPVPGLLGTTLGMLG